MVMYTGYFARLKKYQDAGLVPISISRWKPKWFEGEECIDLAPAANLLLRYKNGQASVQDYTEEYNAMLDGLDVKMIAEAASKGRNVVFCCYEKPGDFCHRHLFAKHLREKYGIEIKEYPI